MGAAEHGEVHLAVVGLVAELLLEVQQILVGDDHLVLGLLAAQGRLQGGGLGGAAHDVVHAVGAGGVQLGAQVPQGLGGDVLGQAGEHGDALADLVAHHAQQMVLIVGLHVGLHVDHDVALPVLVQQQAVLGHAAGDGGAQGAVGALPVGPGAPHGVHIGGGAGLGEGADLAEVGDVGGDVGGAVIGQHRPQAAVGRVGAAHVVGVLLADGVGAGPGEIAQAEAGVDGGVNPAAGPRIVHLLGKPQIARLVAQGDVGPGDGDHAGGVEGLPQGKLDLHGIGGALSVLAIHHGLLFVSELHV